MSPSRPHVPTANTCENCDKHLRVVHPGPRCDRCLPDDMTELKTCACHLARYCNALCQKNHWATHRVACQTARKNTEVAHILGAEGRHLSFVDWCKHSRNLFYFSALWALGAGTDADRTATHFFVIYIDVDEEISTISKTRFKRRLRNAKCASEADLKREFAARYSSEWQVPPAAPLCARIWIVDDGLPRGLESGNLLAEMIGIAEIRSQVFLGMECDWLALLEESIAIGVEIPPYKYIHRLGSTQTADEFRSTHTKRWTESYGEQFAMAAYSALDVSRHPDRIVTHCLTLYVDVEEKRPGAFGKNIIRSAKMTSLVELRPLFHCDVHGIGAQVMRETLFSRPNALRILIVDDSLPFGRNIQPMGMDMSKVSNPRTLYTYRSDWLARLKKIVEK
ncbi:hypothetical protein C8R45DRAFT_529463 [Mycena sanguinolenta]|nr:hypothetical protein C8R45DRAFT_529463 [Mycena sanguinolenta]